MTYSDLKSEYLPYSDFAPFKNRRIYCSNTSESAYYENISIHPDRILADLVHIFHPELMPDHKPMCYSAMQ